MEYINENVDPVNEIQISNTADWFSFKKEASSNDPFDIGEDELRKVNGLSPAFRRKMGREFSKRFEGVDGAGTQQN